MASGAKRKTTMAKLNRERAVIEKRHKKAARKDARKREAAESGEVGGGPAIGPSNAYDMPAASSEPAASSS